MQPNWRLAVILALTLIGVVCSSCAPRPVPPNIPHLPTTVGAAGGVVHVRRTWPVLVGEDSAWGSYDPATRQVLIDSTAPPLHQWRVLQHELVHAALDDSGLAEVLSPEVQEAIAQAIAAQRVAERQYRAAWRIAASP